MPRIGDKSPSALSRLGSGIKKFGKDVGHDVKEVAKDVAGWKPKQLGKDLKNAGATAGSELVGVAELAGLRYPVSKYEFKVSEGLTRGSRIDDPKGYDSLVKQGFKGIVDLTLEGTNDAKAGKKAGLNTFNVRILDNSAPTQKQMKDFLDFATNPKNSPCYVHCEAGKGRTGVAVACYRMAVEGWPPEKAAAEAKKFGCSLPDQQDFIAQFGADLAKGKIAGYPL
ncbi:MAG: tyrosine-protein phosphatase [Myxococcaceae bacterium]